MGRSPKAEWAFVTKLSALGRGQFVCRCIFCSHSWGGGPDRIRAHILGLVGHGVDGPCPCASQEAIDVCRRGLNVAPQQPHEQHVQHVHAQVDSLDDLASVQGTSTCASVGQDCQPTTGSGATQCSVHMHVNEERSKKRKKTNTLQASWNIAACNDATIALRRFFYAEDIPHWKVRSPFFLDMVRAIANAGPAYAPPSYNDMRTKELNNEMQCLDAELSGIREKWVKYGCTIVSDGWADTRRRPIINFMACSINGSVFLKSVDTSGFTKTGEFIFRHLREIIISVGPSNVVQVCMDNASNCIRAGQLVEEEWPHIFFTRCACHCLDLLFEDIGKIARIADILEKATEIVSFVTRKTSVLAVFRDLSKKDLVRPSMTRFAYMYIMLKNLCDERCMTGLKKLMVDDRYVKLKVSKSSKALTIYVTVYSPTFWQEAKMILKICAPILKILRLADREGATMGLVYELTDLMIEKLQNLQDVDAYLLEEVKTLCIGRWEMLHTPLHAVGYMLHPVWKGKNQDLDKEVHEGWMSVLRRYTRGDLELQGALLDEYDIYKNEGASFAQAIAKDEKRWQLGVKWWETFGACTPKLQALALRVLSQGTCASPCERNWSTYSLIQTKTRNRLLPSHAEKLLYIHTNLRLISKIKERGYERIECTLELLNNEKDEERLLGLQDLQEECAELNVSALPTGMTINHEGEASSSRDPNDDEDEDHEDEDEGDESDDGHENNDDDE